MEKLAMILPQLLSKKQPQTGFGTAMSGFHAGRNLRNQFRDSFSGNQDGQDIDPMQAASAGGTIGSDGNPSIGDYGGMLQKNKKGILSGLLSSVGNMFGKGA